MNRFLCLATVFAAGLSAQAGYGQSPGGFANSEMNRLQSVGNPAVYGADRIRSSVVNSSVPRYSFAGVTGGINQNVFGGTPSKPFSSIQRGPSVTPYLALNQPFSDTATNYYTLIRPQQEQQRLNQQVQRQQQLMQRAMGQFTQQAAFNPKGSESMAPTGHASVYMNYGGYYTPPAPSRR